MSNTFVTVLMLMLVTNTAVHCLFMLVHSALTFKSINVLVNVEINMN